MALMYFAENNSGSEQLWITDGSASGAHLVKVFAGGAITGLTMIGARVYFVTDDGVNGAALWVSDGTAGGTIPLTPFGTGFVNLTNVNGTLFFHALGGPLWKSDGTPAGTTVIATNHSIFTSEPPLVNINATVFFQGMDAASFIELWKSDGTAAGTTIVKNLRSPFFLTNVNGTLFFAADDGTHGMELWKSDGSDAGTVLVKDIVPGSGSGISTFIPGAFANVSGTLFFVAQNGTTNFVPNFELWKSDGTAAGTVMVANDVFPELLTNIGGTLFFAGGELWKSDGTAAGTVMVKDINPGVNGSLASNFTDVNGTVFFAATDGIHGLELWKSDGTDAGTTMVKDINPNSDSGPQNLTNVNGVLEFTAFDGATRGLFRSDGTAAGTIEIATNVDIAARIGYAPQPSVNDMNGDARSDILWRSTTGTLASWTMNGGSITSSGALISGGIAVAPDASWSIAGISDFNGDGNADALWRNSDGTLADWLMNGSTIMSGGVLNVAGTAVKPDATWSVVGTGDFDGNSRADILWRKTDGTITEWNMNGSSILGGGAVFSNGSQVKPDFIMERRRHRRFQRRQP